MAKFVQISIAAVTILFSGRAFAQTSEVDIPAGMDFECEAEWTIEECKDRLSEETWYEQYGELSQKWRDELLYNTNIYFHPIERSREEGLVSASSMDFIDENSNLLDATYRVALRRYSAGWAIAIEMICTGNARREPEKCKPVLRMVSFDKEKIVPKKIERPVSQRQVVTNFQPFVQWRETDLRKCKPALNHLVEFPANNDLWHPKFKSWIKGKSYTPSDDIVVTMDGDSVFIRARGEANPTSPYVSGQQKYIVYDDRNRGDGYSWAKEMRELVEPCLGPSDASPPWEKILKASESKAEVFDDP